MNKDNISKMHRKILGVIQEELQSLVNDQMLTLMKSVGIDFGRLREMLSGEAGLDPYVVLGLDRSASDDEVKKRYRALIHKLHPDTSGIKGTDFLFQMVRAAYESVKRERKWQ